MPFKSIAWESNVLVLLDQRALPHESRYTTVTRYDEVIDAIKTMVVRGAPAIGIAAAYGVCLSVKQFKADPATLRENIKKAISELKQSRPTAVNLAWALERMESALESARGTPDEICAALLEKAHSIYQTDIETNLDIAKHGLALVPDNATVIHHCNTGSLATADYGTALGVIRYAHEQGKKIHAYLDETRPRLQGASLSAYELQAYGVPHTVIIDSASGHVMKTRKVDLCIVGCDRVAANGDTANKIGTYNLALVAKAHNVPFYVACPTTTLDLQTPSGETIEIEDRAGEEITEIGGKRIAPIGTEVYNPAFDITPADLISAFITEKGILYPPYSRSLKSVL